MLTFEELMIRDGITSELPTKPQVNDDTALSSSENTNKIKTVSAEPTVGSADDFEINGETIHKGLSPFETENSRKKILNPNQKPLLGYLQAQRQAKAVKKANDLYSAFLRHCALNKIDSNTIQKR